MKCPYMKTCKMAVDGENPNAINGAINVKCQGQVIVSATIPNVCLEFLRRKLKRMRRGIGNWSYDYRIKELIGRLEKSLKSEKGE